MSRSNQEPERRTNLVQLSGIDWSKTIKKTLFGESGHLSRDVAYGKPALFTDIDGERAACLPPTIGELVESGIDDTSALTTQFSRNVIGIAEYYARLSRVHLAEQSQDIQTACKNLADFAINHLSVSGFQQESLFEEAQLKLDIVE